MQIEGSDKGFEKAKKAIGDDSQFIHGDTAVAYGALLAGCRFFGGYPITPASEIAEKMSELLPKVGGKYIQMEDELGSIASVIGSSWAGAKAMTATSGPGFSLMQENIGFAHMSETPLVLANVQRSGPSTGQPTLGAQGDIMQARYGSHGDFASIALSPNSVQETLDLTIKAFNLAEEYRAPVFLMLCADMGHMREMVRIPNEIETFERKRPKVPPEEYIPFGKGEYGKEKVPEFGVFGEGFRTYVTGLTHDEKGFPATDDQEDHDRLIRRQVEKIQDDREELADIERRNLDDADVAILSYGITSRSAIGAMKRGREKGEKIGYFRLRTLWPFPIEEVKKLSQRVDKIVVAEMNLGQIYHKVAEHADCEVALADKIGGEIHSPEEILAEV
uniref:Pyruvate flavodoxin/ferredoxin oxidoreductase domain protein n=1 Tax=uncultured organism TaxID=155900 RepID=M1PV62_9ZZZZ|nr:pyruvate flavodoxin/ferredoxin oxidoreductase domain protein [uncultured organism]